MSSTVVVCPFCGASVLDSVTHCARCGEPRGGEIARLTELAASRGVSLDDMYQESHPLAQGQLSFSRRSQLLDAAIVPYIEQGYVLAERTPAVARLVKHKQINWVVLVLSFSTVVFAVAYLAYYLNKRSVYVLIAVDNVGNVRVS